MSEVYGEMIKDIFISNLRRKKTATVISCQRKRSDHRTIIISMGIVQKMITNCCGG